MPSKRNKQEHPASPAWPGLSRNYLCFAAITAASILAPACGGSSPSGPKPADAEMKAIHGRSDELDTSFYTLDAGDGLVCGYYRSRKIYSFDKKSGHYLATKNGPIRQSELVEAIDEFIVEQINTAQNAEGQPLEPAELRDIRNTLNTIKLVGVTATVPFSLVGGTLAIPVGVVLEIRNLFKKRNIDYPGANLAGTFIWGTIPTWLVLAKTDEQLGKVNTSLEGYKNRKSFDPSALKDEDTVNEVSGSLVWNAIWFAEKLSKKTDGKATCPEPKVTE